MEFRREVSVKRKEKIKRSRSIRCLRRAVVIK